MRDRTLASERHDILAGTIVHQVLLPFVGASIGVAYGTGRWDLSAVSTGLAVTGALALVWQLDRKFVQPHLQRIHERDSSIHMVTGAGALGEARNLGACQYPVLRRTGPHCTEGDYPGDEGVG